MPQIKIRFDKQTNKLTVEGEGFNGTECIKKLDALQKSLELKTKSRRPKPGIKQTLTHIQY